VKYWEIIADNLSKSGWSWGCVSAIDSNGRTLASHASVAADTIKVSRTSPAKIRIKT
jgi:hypothetical protein